MRAGSGYICPCCGARRGITARARSAASFAGFLALADRAGHLPNLSIILITLRAQRPEHGYAVVPATISTPPRPGRSPGSHAIQNLPDENAEQNEDQIGDPRKALSLFATSTG